jgi:hypothetical protein
VRRFSITEGILTAFKYVKVVTKNTSLKKKTIKNETIKRVYEKKIEDPQEVTKDELELPTHEKMHI